MDPIHNIKVIVMSDLIRTNSIHYPIPNLTHKGSIARIAVHMRWENSSNYSDKQ